MAVQNLVSATIAPETKAEILKSLADVRGKLDFLLSLRGAEVSALFKAGKEMVPFVDACHDVVQSSPEILSGVFNRAEFDRDWQLSRDLAQITEAVTGLSQALTDTLVAVRSDTLVAALDVYAAVKAHRTKVPGLGATADNLGRYFARRSRPTDAKAP